LSVFLLFTEIAATWTWIVTLINLRLSCSRPPVSKHIRFRDLLALIHLVIPFKIIMLLDHLRSVRLITRERRGWRTRNMCSGQKVMISSAHVTTLWRRILNIALSVFRSENLTDRSILLVLRHVFFISILHKLTLILLPYLIHPLLYHILWIICSLILNLLDDVCYICIGIRYLLHQRTCHTLLLPLLDFLVSL